MKFLRCKKSGRRTKTHAKERKEKAAKSVDDDWWKERRKLFHFWIAVSNGFWVEWIKKTKQFFSASKKGEKKWALAAALAASAIKHTVRKWLIVLFRSFFFRLFTLTLVFFLYFLFYLRKNFAFVFHVVCAESALNEVDFF